MINILKIWVVRVNGREVNLWTEIRVVRQIWVDSSWRLIVASLKARLARSAWPELWWSEPVLLLPDVCGWGAALGILGVTLGRD